MLNSPCLRVCQDRSYCITQQLTYRIALYCRPNARQSSERYSNVYLDKINGQAGKAWRQTKEWFRRTGARTYLPSGGRTARRVQPPLQRRGPERASLAIGNPFLPVSLSFRGTSHIAHPTCRAARGDLPSLCRLDLLSFSLLPFLPLLSRQAFFLGVLPPQAPFFTCDLRGVFPKCVFSC